MIWYGPAIKKIRKNLCQTFTHCAQNSALFKNTFVIVLHSILLNCTLQHSIKYICTQLLFCTQLFLFALEYIYLHSIEYFLTTKLSFATVCRTSQKISFRRQKWFALRNWPHPFLSLAWEPQKSPCFLAKVAKAH